MELSDIIRNSFSIDKIYDEMYEKDPEFRKFVAENKNITAEQIAERYGIKLKENSKFCQ